MKILEFVGWLIIATILLTAGAAMGLISWIGKHCFNLFNDYPIVATFTAVSLAFLTILHLTASILGSY